MVSRASGCGPGVYEASFPVAGKTALVVEDDVSSALSLKVLLERAKMNVVAAVTAASPSMSLTLTPARASRSF